ncbi:hypothetical protein FJR48_01050 [Sulfurimonas lithotrophica]|uniref:STAS domain-containing protein n=1 Tax=Sulfurimonas lithotrophica TaxID=2590022 RepID=A0A5P8NY99_9BACT|nr:hypothetical protein [Sulfurimonas lithotrophica]QFR48386.1 hypothetical protein FJR48_01050 [Sulfurimonas lithotrophica]
MDISTSGSEVKITGNIKSVSDFQTIKSTLDSVVVNNSSINLIIEDSISITSSVIGYLNKLILKDGIKLTMSVGNDDLISLLNDLNLSSVFNVRKK